MTASFQFDNSSIFEGFTVSYKINEDMSKTIILAECFRRLENVLDSLNLQNLQKTLKNECFVIKQSIENLEDGGVVMISKVH